MGAESPNRGGGQSGAVFISYASQDAEAAQKICDALRAAGLEVWFDKSELRGGDIWDRQIREQIHSCRLFIPIISANTEARDEGYFRREWGFAADRTRDIAEKRAFLVPVVIDDTPERGSSVPDKFHQIQWTRLPGGETPPAFVARVTTLLGAPAPVAPIDRPARVLASAPPAHTQNWRNLWIVLGLAAVVVTAGGGWFASQHSGLHRHAESGAGSQSQPALTEKSIAVLPFVDMSEKHDQEYFGDGMAEEILNLLVQVPGLKVIGRTSSFRFKGKTDDLRNVGEQLGARYLLEGSVRRSSDHLRVTAQLIDSTNGSHRWSETYDRTAGDALDLQNQIAASLVRALQLEIVPSFLVESRLSTSPDESYDLYLRGLHALNRNDQQGFEEGIAYFRHSLDLDPAFAPAAEALAVAVTGMADEDYVAADIGWEQARKAAQSALRLNPRSARAHAILGYADVVHDWDWVGAERELALAMSLAPNDPVVLTHAAQHRLAVGHLAEAAHLLEAAGAADPLDPFVLSIKAWVYERQGRLADARNACDRALQISPTFAWQHFYLGVVFLDGGDARSALAEMEKEVHAGARQIGLADAYWALGQTRQADAALIRVERDGADDMPLEIAEAYAFRGNKDRAFEWLERAYAKRDSDLYYVKGDPLLRNLETDPRYKAFLRKMNLPE
jgi:TolB-like protein/Flp pilus assembly protein TadD